MLGYTKVGSGVDCGCGLLESCKQKDSQVFPSPTRARESKSSMEKHLQPWGMLGPGTQNP